MGKKYTVIGRKEERNKYEPFFTEVNYVPRESGSNEMAVLQLCSAKLVQPLA